MIKRPIYLSILFLLGCNTLVEQTAPLRGDFYIQDGWLAFTSERYDEANKHFNAAIETNDEGSGYHFLSYIGKGWTFMYNAITESDSILVSENMVDRSSEYFNTALSILPQLDDSLFIENDVMNLYFGLTLQRTYSAKQKAANKINWETNNIELNAEIDILYRQSIAYSFGVESPFIFQYDTSLDYEDIILLRIENYILIGEIDSALFYYQDHGFECYGYDIDEDSIIECLCITINDGDCPFSQE